MWLLLPTRSTCNPARPTRWSRLWKQHCCMLGVPSPCHLCNYSCRLMCFELVKPLTSISRIMYTLAMINYETTETNFETMSLRWRGAHCKVHPCCISDGTCCVHPCLTSPILHNDKQVGYKDSLLCALNQLQTRTLKRVGMQHVILHRMNLP